MKNANRIGADIKSVLLQDIELEEEIKADLQFLYHPEVPPDSNASEMVISKVKVK